MSTDLDSMMDRRDRELGAMGHGPYAGDVYDECACCGSVSMIDDMHEVGTDTCVWLCVDCTDLLRRGEMLRAADAERLRKDAVRLALRSVTSSAATEGGR